MPIQIIDNFELAGVGFVYNTESIDFIDSYKNNLTTAIQEAKLELELEPAPAPAPPAPPAPPAEPPAAELKSKTEKTPVQTLLKKQMINLFRERRERNRKKGEEGGE